MCYGYTQGYMLCVMGISLGYMLCVMGILKAICYVLWVYPKAICYVMCYGYTQGYMLCYFYVLWVYPKACVQSAGGVALALLPTLHSAPLCGNYKAIGSLQVILCGMLNSS